MADIIVFGIMSLMALFITGYFLCAIIGAIVHVFRGTP